VLSAEYPQTTLSRSLTLRTVSASGTSDFPEIHPHGTHVREERGARRSTSSRSEAYPRI